MEKQISKKKLERMCVSGGNFSRPGERKGNNQLSVDQLKNLLADDVANLEGRAEENEKRLHNIDDEELAMLMDRGRCDGWLGNRTVPAAALELPSTRTILHTIAFHIYVLLLRLFNDWNVDGLKAAEPSLAVPESGKFYDIVAAGSVDGILGKMD